MWRKPATDPGKERDKERRQPTWPVLDMSSSRAIPKGNFRCNERRCHAREPLDEIVLVLFGQNDWGKLIEVSEGGMSFEFSEPPPQREAIHFRFEPMGSIPSKSRTEIISYLEGRGKAVWTREFERTAGVQFVDLNEANREQIRHWLAFAVARRRALTDDNEEARREEPQLESGTALSHASPEPIADFPEARSKSADDSTDPGSPSVQAPAEAFLELEPGPRPASWDELDLAETLSVAERIHEEQYASEPASTDAESSQTWLARRSTLRYLTKYAEAWSVSISRRLREPLVVTADATPQKPSRESHTNSRRNVAAVIGVSGCMALLMGIAGQRTIGRRWERRSAAVADAANSTARQNESPTAESAAKIHSPSQFFVDVVDASGRKWQLWFDRSYAKNADAQSASVAAQPLVLPKGSAQTTRRQQIPSSRASTIEPSRQFAVGPTLDRAVVQDSSVTAPPASVATPPASSAVPTASLSPPAALGNTFPNHEPEVPPPSPAAVRVSELQEARLIRSVSPAYPPFASNMEVSGDVSLEALIDASGNVTQAKAISGPGILHDAAVAAVMQWKYEPARLNGKPFPSTLTVTVKFRLH